MTKETEGGGAEVPSVVVAAVDRFKALQMEDVVSIDLAPNDGYTTLTLRLGLMDPMNLSREHEIATALQRELMKDTLEMSYLERVRDDEGVTLSYSVVSY